MDWLAGGAGVLAGGVGARALPQIILGTGNTGAIGYVANAAAALLLGWLSHMFFPKQRVLTVTVIAGGMAALLQRVITDKTSYGSLLTNAGIGDYMAQDFLTPQRLVNGLDSAATYGPQAAAVLVASEGAGGMNNTPGGMSSYNLW